VCRADADHDGRCQQPGGRRGLRATSMRVSAMRNRALMAIDAALCAKPAVVCWSCLARDGRTGVTWRRLAGARC
jgi:hypothetical protein